MRRERLKDIQQQNGKSSPNVINALSDGMYNNNLYSGVGKTPFQPATQVIYSLAENVTQQHDIIGLVVHNKLCSKGKHLRPSDEHHQCLGKDCSATIPFEKSIGDEKTWAKELLQELKESNDMEVEYLTTDPDSGAYQAATDLHETGITKTKPTHQLDTRHISKKNSRLSEILKGNTAKLRTQIQNKLAIDLSERCHGEICKAFEKYGNDIDLIRNKLTFALMQLSIAIRTGTLNVQITLYYAKV
ncbi:unnamed protein product [Mytilus coruscus]|uniref:Mutator-like transposase domain-containing protein n=1 Tax=Mytilus coruscus TaxID=42192 RepID=A0A6J8APT8_MYTCO|nr:unnamed protein product [Mytilus coruscus]